MSELLEGLTNSTFMIEGAEFRVLKLKGLEGFELLEKIRVALAGQSMGSAMTEGSTEGEIGANMMHMIFSINPKDVAEIRSVVFQNLDVKLPDADRAVAVSKVEAILTDLIEPVDIYEIIVRFIAVNFTKSIVGMMNRLGLRQAE